MTHRIAVKFYAENDPALKSHELVPVFHSWIQSHAFPDHALIDVADYGHVHDGPGTVLIAHEANFYLDRSDGRLGFTYSRKQPYDGDFEAQLKQAFDLARKGCAKLEEDLGGRLRFRRNEASVTLNDRLLAPNTEETFQQLRPTIERVASQFLGSNVELRHTPDPENLFTVQVSTPSR